MKYLKKSGLAAALALVATCGATNSAWATTLDPAATAFTLSSSNSSLAISGGGVVSCTGSSITGTTPATGGATTLSIPVTLTYSGCAAFTLTETVTPNAACNSGTTQIKLDLMSVSATTAAASLTMPAGCNIDMSIPALGCTMTITGPQTLGNGTTGAGGIAWTNASPKSLATINSAVVANIDSTGGSFGCPTAGVHTGTRTGTYTVSSATNVTVTP